MNTRKTTRRGIAYCVQNSIEYDGLLPISGRDVAALPTAFSSTLGLFAFVIGALLGWMCCYLLVISGGSADAVLPIVLVAVCACVVFASVRLIVTGVQFVDNRTANIKDTRNDDAAVVNEGHTCVADGCVSTVDEEYSHRCDLVAKEFGLSHREREVLGLLARGRNADYIKDALVISPCTAKSHIYNVYKKMGVHEQQSVIDCVEAADGAIEPYELW